MIFISFIFDNNLPTIEAIVEKLETSTGLSLDVKVKSIKEPHEKAEILTGIQFPSIETMVFYELYSNIFEYVVKIRFSDNIIHVSSSDRQNDHYLVLALVNTLYSLGGKGRNLEYKIPSYAKEIFSEAKKHSGFIL